MAKINILDFQVANMIAAGEVVDRPASVVKELVENSIDAGATAVDVEIRRGGVSYIRVTDNGCGMSREDAELCFLRHATSKIKEAKDLDGIRTLGFRGEALAAISSVSQIELFTRPEREPVGTRIECACGRITEVADAGCKKGTSMLVKELFANVPARRKFLKQDRSEGMAVAAVVEKEALAHPEVSFRFTSDGTLKLQTAGDKKLYNAIYALLGRDFAKKTIAVKGKSEAVEVFGYIGQPDNVRVNRNYQNFFINGRYVKSRTATAALEQAFSSFMESEKFPCCVLNIVLHPALVDVNVHPTKLEVKFSNEKVVFDAVYLAVRNALLCDTTRPELPMEKKDIKEKAIATLNRFSPVYDRISDGKSEQIGIFSGSAGPKEKADGTEIAEKAKPDEVPKVPFDDLPFIFEDIVKEVARQEEEKTEKYSLPPKNQESTVSPEPKDERSIPALGGFSLAKEERPEGQERTASGAELLPEFSCRKEPSDNNPEAPDSRKRESRPLWKRESEISPELPGNPTGEIPSEKEEFRLIGTAFDTYILAEVGDKLLMIDKHAAHERLLFEKMKSNLSAPGKHYTQLLLLPETLEVGKMECAAAAEYEESIEKAGFLFQINEGEDSAEISGIPGGLEKEQALILFGEIVTRLASGEGDAELSKETAFEKALYTASCKAAMKGSRQDDEVHLKYIVRELLRLPDIRYCPHGRPVAFEIPKGSIEHKFKRS